MIKIRKNVFETNSSSTHSVTFNSDSPLSSLDPNIEINEEGYITVRPEGFCSWCNYVDQQSKLAYIIQLCAYCNDIYFSSWNSAERRIAAENLYETEMFKEIEDEIISYVGSEYKGIRLDIDYDSGYIDDGHDYNSVQEFLDEEGMSLIEFIFGDTLLHYEYNG